MDKRGLTTDPTREGQHPRWWEEIGPTQKPSPYAENSWVSYQDVFTASSVVPGSIPPQTRKVTFGVIKVYDYLASHPYPETLSNDTNIHISELSEQERGVPMGSLSYEIEGGLLTITDWSHYSWHNAAPVSKAFRSLTSSIPECVTTIVVYDEPTSFWVSLGFELPFKGSELLVFDKSSLDPIPY